MHKKSVRLDPIIPMMMIDGPHFQGRALEPENGVWGKNEGGGAR
jgi:hypothetical protein